MLSSLTVTQKYLHCERGHSPWLAYLVSGGNHMLFGFVCIICAAKYQFLWGPTSTEFKI